MTQEKARHTIPRIIPRTLALAFVLLLASHLTAAPFRLLAIGDSLTEEYRFELPFSAPDSNPTNANVKNWVEMLHQHRSADFSMGNYEPSVFNYLDYRNAGYEYNYGVPGFTAKKWDMVLYDPGFLTLEYNTRRELSRDLSSVNAVLIFVGGNDLSLYNSDAKNNEIRIYISRIHDYVRANAPANLPIIIATVPDIGATPAEALPEPDATAARQRVATLNANIIADLGSRSDSYIARIDALTDRIFDQVPFHLNGTEFIYPPDDQNPPLQIFCKDGFHPGDVGQALIANEILKAINQFAETPIPLFTNREILTAILAQNPDQPFLDWAGSAGGQLENPDNDPLPNLLEYLLGTSPTQPNPAFTFLPEGAATFSPSADAVRFADLTVLQSATLTDDWTPVPQSNLFTLPDGSMKIIPTAPKLFYKFQATPKP